MPFDWKNYLTLAKFLANEDMTDICSNEASMRSAVSRAYYSVFCYARNYAKEMNGWKHEWNENTHREIKEHFKDKGRLEISGNLDDLRKWRNQCDYDDLVPELDKILKDSISRQKKYLIL